MDAKTIRGLKPRLNKILNEFADGFSRKDTRRHLMTYVNEQLSALPRKSVEPMARRLIWHYRMIGKVETMFYELTENRLTTF